MYHSLFTIVPLPKGTVSLFDQATQTTTIYFSEAQKIVLDADLKIKDVLGMDAALQGRIIDGYSSDGFRFVDIKSLLHLQLPDFKDAVSSGKCVIRLRKI